MLSPKPRPSEIPAATASTFFSAPASSQPLTSTLVYTRKVGDISVHCTRAAAASSASATTAAVG